MAVSLMMLTIFLTIKRYACFDSNLSALLSHLEPVPNRAHPDAQPIFNADSTCELGNSDRSLRDGLEGWVVWTTQLIDVSTNF
jgi:hypothetical protein